jgi:hypothetical protein
MSLRVRHTFQLFPGVRLNLSGGGVSASFGVPGATVNVGSRGVYGTIGLPGSGISYRTRLTPGAALHPRPPNNGFAPERPAGPREPPPALLPPMHEIGSAAVETLTSGSLVELRDMIDKARGQRAAIERQLKTVRDDIDKLSRELDRRKRSLFRWLYKRRVAELEMEVPDAKENAEELVAGIENTRIDVSFEIGDEAQKAYGALVRAFEKLRACASIWDVTADRGTNRFVERTVAGRAVDRKPVQLDFASHDLVRFDGRAMRFGNVNGEDILIYPGIILMPRADGAFALIDLRELKLGNSYTQFQEAEAVPRDAKIVGHTWLKANKDNTPDRRFNNNRQIPVCLYGQLAFSTSNGVTEEYMFSNVDAAVEFAAALKAFQEVLAAL